MKENVAIPFPVSKDDTTAPNSDVKKETAEVDTGTEELIEIIDTFSLEDLVDIASERQEREDLDAQQSQLKDELWL